MPYQELYRVLSTITRVVVHPKYRTIGLGAKLVRETLPKAGTPYVELVAVMARYNPFAERAGMTRVAESKPEPRLLRAAEELAAQGFNIHLLGSRRYIRSKLETLTPEELERDKKALSAAVEHPKILKKLMRIEMIFGYRKEGLTVLEKANVDKLTELISTLSILLQTKVYLFWRVDELKAEKHV
jgi:ABC-type ATPase with predicted acetyltransferase domain